MRAEAVSRAWVGVGRRPLPLERELASDMALRTVEVHKQMGTTPFDRFLIRPGSEAVLAGYWPRLSTDPITSGLADPLVAALTGEVARPRADQGASAPDRHGRQTVYAPSDIAVGWTDRVNAAEATNAEPFILACHAYAEVALSHPMPTATGGLRGRCSSAPSPAPACSTRR